MVSCSGIKICSSIRIYLEVAQKLQRFANYQYNWNNWWFSRLKTKLLITVARWSLRSEVRLHVMQFTKVTLLKVIYMLLINLKHVVLLHFVLCWCVKVVYQCNAMFGTVIHTGQILNSFFCSNRWWSFFPHWNWNQGKAIIKAKNTEKCSQNCKVGNAIR